MLSELPIQHISVKDLDALVRDPGKWKITFGILLADVTIQIPACTRYGLR